MPDQALDLPARTLHKLLPTPEICQTIRWMAQSAHPAAKLIKRLQFTRETKDWEDRAGVTEIIYTYTTTLRVIRTFGGEEPTSHSIDLPIDLT